MCSSDLLVRDVVGAVRALRRLPEADPDRIVLAGSSVGGSAVAFALGTRPDMRARGGVGLSALDGPREAALGERGAFRPHGLLLITDQRESDNARNLRAAAHGRGVTVFTTDAVGHGVDLLADPEIRERALAWLQRLTS